MLKIKVKTPSNYAYVIFKKFRTGLVFNKFCQCNILRKFGVNMNFSRDVYKISR